MSIGGDGYGDERDYADSGRRGTRTRLPESETAARPPVVRPGKTLLTVVGVVVLLIAALAFATRGGGGNNADGKAPDQTQPTAPTGVAPVEGGTGIPSGFARTEQGAQSAAANYAVALVSAEIIQPGARPEIVQRVFVPGKVDDMRARMDEAYSAAFLDKLGLREDGTAPAGSTYVSRTVPVGTKVVSYSSTSTDLEVWCTGVYGLAGQESTTPVTTDWFTMKLKLAWADGDWKVESFAQEAGPAPVNGDLRASSADDIAEAVEGFGGFTYAR
ncbi:hypothetical protein QNO07_22925 [Streptomyces sp. 549]|uniref:hypothetical protein n=1 Tax=Streptomyces sp. 549 TaxID=3049076 RepID=UPI0024C3A413|nr:hypothetical protein [Streptomyces sp. 549]MDK1476237.1 hypothetical protein [Streptomyces sp. 549]